MSIFRIGAHELSLAETSLIQTIVRLYGQNPSFHWVFADQAPYDALIISSDHPQAGSPALARLTRVQLKLTPWNDDSEGHALKRPLRAEKLAELLQSTQAELLRSPLFMHPGVGTVASGVEAGASRTCVHTRYRLMRWPNSALLRNDPARLRMSSLLARKPMQVTELAELSLQSIDTCSRFIETLMPTGLLKAEAVELAQPVRAQVSRSRSFIRGIRRHLGI